MILIKIDKMKNIHVLATEKPSRLYKHTGKFVLDTISVISIDDISINKNIYIVSNEEIKERDWVFNLDTQRVVKADKLKVSTSKKSRCWYYKKIILTTDQDLIEDGVQAIPDEFLEWFVKNPSCEEVEVDLVPVNEFGSEITVNGYGFDKFIYKIIIPKEEPFKHEVKVLTKEEVIEGRRSAYEFIDFDKQNLREYPLTPNECFKQETIEEAFEKWSEEMPKGYDKLDVLRFGAKWQQERSYSEEEVLKFLKDCLQNYDLRNGRLELKDWFEQFKKK